MNELIEKSEDLDLYEEVTIYSNTHRGYVLKAKPDRSQGVEDRGLDRFRSRCSQDMLQ